MKRIKNVLKRTFQILGLLLALIILAGLIFRLVGPEPHQPLGELVDVDGVKFHINVTGTKSSKPTLVIEGGAGSSTEYYHWLSEGLKDSLRVVRYDRAGAGYSELDDTPREAGTIAKELHKLLEEAGESPPYILAGHSMGGPYIRVFTQMYPDEVVGLIFIDSTHPEQAERFNAAPESSFRFKSAIWGLKLGVFFADAGVLGLLESFNEPIFAAEGLPDEINKRTKDFLLNGKCLRAYTRETKNYHKTLKQAKDANQFGTIPIRVFTATEINKESYRERGIDPDDYMRRVIEAQKEYAALSSNGKQFLIDGNHQTIFTKRENAEVICKEIIELLSTIED